MNDKFKKYLPLGSVVLMKGGKKRIMVTGYAVKAPETGDRIWDYIGCLWPEGMITPDKNLLFDHKDIQQIFAIGYSDDEQKRFMSVLDKATQLRDDRLAQNNTDNDSTNSSDTSTTSTNSINLNN